MLVHRNLRFSPLKKAVATLISAFPCKQVASLDIDRMTIWAGHPHPFIMNGGMGSVKQHIAKANEADCLANAEVQTREEGGDCNKSTFPLLSCRGRKSTPRFYHGVPLTQYFAQSNDFLKARQTDERQGNTPQKTTLMYNMYKSWRATSVDAVFR